MPRPITGIHMYMSRGTGNSILRVSVTTSLQVVTAIRKVLQHHNDDNSNRGTIFELNGQIILKSNSHRISWACSQELRAQIISNLLEVGKVTEVYAKS